MKKTITFLFIVSLSLKINSSFSLSKTDTLSVLNRDIIVNSYVSVNESNKDSTLFVVSIKNTTKDKYIIVPDFTWSPMQDKYGNIKLFSISNRLTDIDLLKMKVIKPGEGYDKSITLKESGIKYSKIEIEHQLNSFIEVELGYLLVSDPEQKKNIDKKLYLNQSEEVTGFLFNSNSEIIILRKGSPF